MCCLQETRFNFKDTESLKWKGQKTIFYVNSKQKREVTILISDQMDSQKLSQETKQVII